MKLNLGSGSVRGIYKNSEWINVDSYEGVAGRKNTVTASMDDLPFEDETFEEIRSIHSLEHVPRSLHSKVLLEVRRVLKPDGVFYVEVPDLVEHCKAIVRIYNNYSSPASQEAIRLRILSIYGKHRYPGDSHCWGFTKHSLRTDLEAAGFEPELITGAERMISSHYKQEPVLLFKSKKS